MIMRVDGVSYSFDTAWSKFLDVMPKFADSHYFDIMTYCCGFIAFMILLIFRPTIKKINRNHIMKKYGYDLFHRENPQLKPIMIYRLWNLFIPIIAGLISMTGYAMISGLSVRIHIKSYWFYVAFLIPVAIYTIYEFLQSGILGWIFTFLSIAFISANNIKYCIEFEDHHKACYAIRYTMVFFGIVGLVKQFAPPLNDLWTIIKNKRKKDLT